MKFILFCLLLPFFIEQCVAKDATQICRECGGKSFCREDMIKCAFEVADVNPNDGRISPSELEKMKSDYMKWWEKMLAWLTKAAKVENIMAKCDYNKDGYVDRHDFDKTEDECIPLKNKKGELSDSLCRAKTVCDRAASNLGHKVY